MARADHRPPGLERFDRAVLVGVGARTRTYAAMSGPGSPFAVRVLRAGVDPERVRKTFAGGGAAVLGHPPPHLEVEGGAAHFVAPLIIGDALSRRPKTPLPPRLATRLVLEIARALENRVHGDLHPRHVLLSGNGRARLIDSDPAAPGSEGYRAPERRHGRPSSWAAEVYAVGAMWLELLTGQLPKDRPGAPFDAPRTPGPISAALRRMLGPEPRDRFRDGDAVCVALQDCLSALPGPDVTVRAWLGSAPWRRPLFWRDTWRTLTAGGGEPTLVEGRIPPVTRRGPPR